MVIRGTNDNDRLPRPGEDNSGNDRIFGGPGNDRLRGGDGNDRLFGEEDNDRLFGQDGNDQIIGADGNDKLRGDAGNDRLDGGAGKNTLTGGAGRDQFDITEIDRPSKITDYAPGEDTLNLQPVLPDFGDPGDVFQNFVQLSLKGADTRIAVDPSGTGTDFTRVAVVKDVDLTAATPVDLGLPDPENVAPVANDDPAATDEDSTTTIDVLNNDSDPDGPKPTLLSVDSGARGSASPNPDGTITYDPRGEFDDLAAGEAAQDQFTYVVRDDGNKVDTATVTVTVQGVNDAPEVDRGIPNETVPEDETLDWVVPDNAFADPDSNLTFDFKLANGGNLPDFISGIHATGFSINPSKFDGGDYDIRVTASDGLQNISVTFELTAGTVRPVNRPDRPSPGGNAADNDVNSQNPSISFDGRFVAFDTFTNEVDPETGTVIVQTQSVLVYDRVTGETIPASPTNQQSNDQLSNAAFDPSISDQGRFVAYGIGTMNVVEPDTDEEPVVSGSQIRLVDLSKPNDFLIVSGIDTVGDGPSFNPDISGDGTRVVFESDADNLSGLDKGERDIFVTDVREGTTTLVSSDETGSGGSGASTNPAISQDGRFVAFESDAPDLTEDPNGTKVDIFVKDLETGDIVRFEGPDDARNPDISGDGRFVVFETISNGEPKTIWLADVSNPEARPDELELNDVPDNLFLGSSSPSISADGRAVSYVAPNSDGWLELRVREVTANGEFANSSNEIVRSVDIENAVLSGDRKFAAFVSTDAFGNGLEQGPDGGGTAVFTTVTDRLLVGDSINQLEASALTFADVVDAGSEDVGALLGPASASASGPESEPASASSWVDAVSPMSLDQVLAPAPDDVV